MPRIDLDVPFHQKDEVKRLGALWDRARKVWYVPQDLDAAPFKPWIETPEDPVLNPNLRAERFFIAETIRWCWRCEHSIALYAFILPADHEFRAADDPQDPGWHPSPNPTLLSYISLLPQAAQACIAAICADYYLDYSKTIHGSYWMNHCGHCQAKQGDFSTLEAHGSPFHLDSTAEVLLREFPEPFLGRASHGDYVTAETVPEVKEPAGVYEQDRKPSGATGVGHWIRQRLQTVKQWLRKLLKRLGF